MAFEQWQYPSEAYICNYIFLLDSLINTTEDVDLLVEEKVIVNDLGSNRSLRDLFNGLCEQIVCPAEKDCYGELVKELKTHHENGWNRTMAKLKSVYFSDLWRGSSTVVGIAILVLTLITLFQSILS